MRNMRQVIKTNHNFMTGEHYEQRVLKPVQASHNRVTIQLCDAASGQVVEEAVTENAITPLFECSAYGSIANALNNDSLPGHIECPSFNSIVLSDSDISELEDLYFIHGNIVGICNRSDTGGVGANKYRGTYNSAESYEKFEDSGYRHIHLVYDWPTSSGNGKIQSIYWLPKGVHWDDRYDARSLYILKELHGTVASSDLYFDRHGNAYKKVSDRYYKVLNLLKYFNGIEPAKIATEESFYTEHEVNGNYYSCSLSYSGSGTNFSMILTLNKHDTNGNVLDTWTEDLIVNVPQLVELRNNSKLGTYQTPIAEFSAYCDFDGWIGVRVLYASANYDYVFPARDSTGELVPNEARFVTVYTMYNVLTKQWLHLPNPWDVWCTYEHYTNCAVIKKLDAKHICSEGYYTQVTSDDVIAESYARNNILPGNLNYAYILKKHSTLPICVCSGVDENHCIAPLSAQTRLAAPITKTTLNTMKIQYDFFFKVPLPYMSPEHVWDLYK